VTFFQDFIYCLLFCGIRAKSTLPDQAPFKHEDQRLGVISELNDSEESFK
jgi:hypothetical protein